MPQPDYHFLYIDPSLDAEWFLVAARRYWERFRPMVIGNLELVSYVPANRSIAITVLARRDMAKMIENMIKQRYPAIKYDPLVYDFLDEIKITLDGRADFQQRFGVPEAPDPTPKPTNRKSR
jgi:hypothetical protein